MNPPRDHGGGLDAALARFGGTRGQWVDLSTGINPIPFEFPPLSRDAWTSLPDAIATEALVEAARDFWTVPAGAAVLAAPGASALIANIPSLVPPGRLRIAERTYNEHEAAFRTQGWTVTHGEEASDARVVVHPNNPTGLPWSGADEPPGRALMVIDESFCDIALGASHVRSRATEPGTLILKSLGKFWGLAGLRLGFAIGDPELVEKLRDALGPWPVSGPALEIGHAALSDMEWANRTRQRLHVDAARLDALMQSKGAEVAGGTALFRLYRVDDARVWQDRLARGHVWSRIFPYEKTWLRLGLPPDHGWEKLEAALA
ncbi:threonine-phosphate decarboxylase [Maritimibacter dapengensis]|uniref:Pyridoxal phosphate-dependent class II aminotransferase n=1 Tax=Maritimibacter dapengensis TaxID=2836868 RepID=A0ABS6SYP6_9RHOB|nr:threonine-phosphate decarboxylase [Maritimibacter dapengensis]MBV7377476.1 pyridoxal phosphate-dependent class II aminotransferase [Maritimibacter dapengensis]